MPVKRGILGHGTNAGGAGEHNRRVVMQMLRLNGPMSRAELSRSTGLVPQTLSNIMQDLEGDGLVLPAETVRGKRGQPAVPYRIAPDGAFALGMQLDQHGARGVGVNLLGQIVARSEMTFSGGGLEANFGRIRGAIVDLQAELGRFSVQQETRITGLGLAMPAPTGVHAIKDDPWMTAPRDDHPILARLEADTGLPVSLHHDAGAAAVAERLNGAAKGINNFVLIFVGYGLGAGIYVHGELHDGHDRLSGELGQIPLPTPQGTISLERVASLAPLYARLHLKPEEAFLFSRIEGALDTNPDAVEGWLAGSAPHFAWLVDLLNCVLDPACIVLGGQMPLPLLRALFERIETLGTDRRSRDGIGWPRFVMGSADVFSVAAGAAAWPIARAFDPSLAAIVKPSGGAAVPVPLPEAS